MSPNELATILVATAAMITSVVAAIEAVRQRKNDVRPVLVVLEKFGKKKERGEPRFLVLVNMGQAVALNIVLKWSLKSQPPPGFEHKDHLTEIAAGRRSPLAQGYTKSIRRTVKLTATYEDVNGIEYETSFDGAKKTKPHTFSRRIKLLSRLFARFAQRRDESSAA